MLKNRLVALRFLLLDMQMASSVLAELKAAKKKALAEVLAAEKQLRWQKSSRSSFKEQTASFCFRSSVVVCL